MDRYYNKYSIIMVYDINDKLLKEHFDLRHYNLGSVFKEYKDAILQYFETIYFSEFAIWNLIIIKNMVGGIDNRKRILLVSYIYYGDMDIELKKWIQFFRIRKMVIWERNKCVKRFSIK